jgi:hypothetical protein
MNLLERLHPIYEDKLSKANLEYPDLIAKVFEDLESIEFVTELKYGTIMDLRCLCGWNDSPFDYFTE